MWDPAHLTLAALLVSFGRGSFRVQSVASVPSGVQIWRHAPFKLSRVAFLQAAPAPSWQEA